MKKAKYGLSEAELRNDGVAYVPCLTMGRNVQTTANNNNNNKELSINMEFNLKIEMTKLVCVYHK